VTDELHRHLIHHLHPKRLDPSIGAIAGLASAVSVVVGFLAQSAMGHGWHRMFITLHLAKKPWIVRLAPVFAGVAVGIATAAALIRFYNWLREPRTDPPGQTPNSGTEGEPAVKRNREPA
jgi:hypothetical protein